MTLKASPNNSRGFEHSENLRITVTRLFDAESVAQHDVGALFQSANIDESSCSAGSSNQRLLLGDAFSIHTSTRLPITCGYKLEGAQEYVNSSPSKRNPSLSQPCLGTIHCPPSNP